MLNVQLWYTRWFFWCCRVMDRFLLTRYKREHNSREKTYLTKGTNLCQFFRTLLIGNIIAGLVVCGYLYCLFVMLVLPLLLFSYESVAKNILTFIIVLVCIVGVIGAAVGCAYLGSKAVVYIHKKAELKPLSEPGFFTLFAHYLVALKQRFCPTIHFTED